MSDGRTWVKERCPGSFAQFEGDAMNATCSVCGRSISLRPNGMMSPHKIELRVVDIPVTEDILGFPIPELGVDDEGNPGPCGRLDRRGGLLDSADLAGMSLVSAPETAHFDLGTPRTAPKPRPKLPVQGPSGRYRLGTPRFDARIAACRLRSDSLQRDSLSRKSVTGWAVSQPRQ